ncbi:zinc ribbon domain-containing protein [Aliidiomarina iranensis]|nr:zinc ribbon domain-containing protein [Aliidiomarina iranensis]
MAIISCPGCGKKVSDKAAVCGECGFMLGAHDVESLARKAQNQRAIKVSKLVSQQMLAILLFIAGIAGTFYDWAQLDGWQFMPQVSMVVTVFSFVWYLVARARIYILKRQR